MNKMIVGKNIVKSFGQGNERQIVLQNVHAEISEGEFVAVMGPSGSGKSTLLFALSGMDSIDSGEVIFDNTKLSSLKEDELSDLRRLKMGFVFQQPTMLKSLNILDNIILPTMRDQRKNTTKVIEKARGLMQKSGIANLEKRDITKVSGGQLQRAGICRALMQDPKVIFADEPTGALDSKSAKDIMKLFLDINQRGTTLMLVTHDAMVAAHSERILIMKDGRIVSELRLSKFDGENINRRVEEVTIQMRKIETI